MSLKNLNKHLNEEEKKLIKDDKNLSDE